MANPQFPADPQALALSQSARSFGLLLAALLLLAGAWRGIRGLGPFWPWLAPAAALAGLAIWWTAPLRPLTRAWLKLADLLHAIVNPVIMALMFALAVVPTGLLMRLFGKDPLRLRFDPQAASYWIPRDPGSAPISSMKDQF